MTIPIQCTPLGMAPSFGFGDRIGLAGRRGVPVVRIVHAHRGASPAGTAAGSSTASAMSFLRGAAG